MGWQDVPPSDAIEAADWIAERLHPFAHHDIGSVVPAGFAAYARIPHRKSAEPQVGVLSESQSRALVALLAKHTTTPQACWLCLWEGYGYLNPGATVWLKADSPLDRLRWLRRRHLRWWGLHLVFRRSTSQEPTGPRVRLPNRDYLLFRGSVAEGAGWEDGPNLWWPDDRAWCVASEIDLDDTYIGGPSALIDGVLAVPGLEAEPANRDQDLSE